MVEPLGNATPPIRCTSSLLRLPIYCFIYPDNITTSDVAACLTDIQNLYYETISIQYKSLSVPRMVLVQQHKVSVLKVAVIWRYCRQIDCIDIRCSNVAWALKKQFHARVERKGRERKGKEMNVRQQGPQVSTSCPVRNAQVPPS